MVSNIEGTTRNLQAEVETKTERGFIYEVIRL